MESIDSFPPITIDQFNRRKFRKRIKIAFQRFEVASRIRLSEDHFSRFKELVKEVQEIYSTDLNKVETYTHGNIYFIHGLFDRHVMFINEFLERFNGVDDKEMRRLSYNVVIEKTEELLKILKQNRKTPVTTKQLLDYVGNTTNEQEDSEEVGIGNR